jgi:TolA-binding protein
MLKKLAKGLSFFLLISITFSFPVLRGEGQRQSYPVAPEITFFGKEETRWTENREIPLPLIMGQGIKEEPALSSLDMGMDTIGPVIKMTPSTTQPGCAYSSRFTRGMLVGDKDLYEKGRFHYLKGNYEDAIQTFRKLIQEHPSSSWNGPALYWMGEAAFHLGKNEEAFSYFEKVVEEYPNTEFYTYALYSSGWIQLKKEVYGEGQRLFHRVYERDRLHVISQSSLFWSGYCLYFLGRHGEAIRELETLLQEYPKGSWRPEAEYLMGINYLKLRQLDEATNLFRIFIKKYNQHPLEESVRYALAWSLVSLGHYTEGRKTFEDLLLAFPGTRLSDPIFWGIQKTYLGSDEVEKAIHFHQRFLSHFLSSPWAEESLFDIGQYYFGKKDYANAAMTFRQFLRNYPESELQARVHFMLGESLFNQKDYLGAMDAYRKVLDEKGKVILENQVLSRLGYANFYIKNYGEATRYWEKLLTSFPGLPQKNEILYWLAEASLLKQDFQGGAEYVDRLKGDSTLYPKGLNSLGWYYFQRRRWKEANDYFVRVLTEFPQYRSSPSISLMVGESYLNQDDYQRAKAYLMGLESLPGGEGDKEKANYLLGWIAYREEGFDEAIGYFQKLLESNPLSLYRDESQYWIAWSYFRKKSYRRGIEEFRRLIQQYPKSPFIPSSLLKIGDGYYNLKQYQQAVQAYLQVVKEHPKSTEAPEADYGVLLSLLQEKEYESFVARVDTFLKLYFQHPLASQVMLQLGNYYQQARMTEKAAKAYRELIRLYPQSEWAEEARFRIALILKKETKWVEMIEEMEKFIRQHPQSHLLVEAYVEVGEVYLLLKDYTKAVERYEWVVKNYPHHSFAKRAYLGTEKGYQSLGKTEETEKILKELVVKFPRDDVWFEGHLRLGLLYLAQKRFGEAISALSLAIRSPEEPTASQAQFKLGEAYLENDNREQAILQFSRVVYLYPHLSEITEEALLKLGPLYMEGKKFSEARQVYRKLLEKTRKEERRETAKKMLGQIDQRIVR